MVKPRHSAASCVAAVVLRKSLAWLCILLLLRTEYVLQINDLPGDLLNTAISKKSKGKMGVFFAFQYIFASSHPGRKTYKVKYPAFHYLRSNSLNAGFPPKVM